MRLADVAKTQRGDYWVTKRYYEFVTHQRNLERERNALQQIMTRPPRVRINTFSASSAGRCLRERQLSFMGIQKTPPDEKAMNIFANGDYVHLRFQTAGLVGGWLKKAEVSVSLPELRLTGTMDGELVNGNGLEIKSINDRGFSEVSTFGPKPDHIEQTHSYMLTRPDIPAFSVVYENKNTQAIKEYEVKRDERIIKRVRDDLVTLNEATDAQVLLPMLPECVEGSGRFARCPFRKTCQHARFASVEERGLPIRVLSSPPRT